MNTDLTAAQKDYALFLPALSGFYSTYVGKQRHGQYVDPARIPSNFVNGIEGMNYLNKKEGMFHYKWSLYSAGHANLDTTKFDVNTLIPIHSSHAFVTRISDTNKVEFIFQNKPNPSLLLSGIFQDETLENVLGGLSYTARFDFKINEDIVTIKFK